MSDELRPMPYDPSAATVSEMIDLDADDWYFTAAGEYQSGAVEAMKRDGSNAQTLIALEWPARLRGTDERRTLRLLISPEDAVGLADVLAHSARWVAAARRLGR